MACSRFAHGQSLVSRFIMRDRTNIKCGFNHHSSRNRNECKTLSLFVVDVMGGVRSASLDCLALWAENGNWFSPKDQTIITVWFSFIQKFLIISCLVLPNQISHFGTNVTKQSTTVCFYWPNSRSNKIQTGFNHLFRMCENITHQRQPNHPSNRKRVCDCDILHSARVLL